VERRLDLEERDCERSKIGANVAISVGKQREKNRAKRTKDKEKKYCTRWRGGGELGGRRAHPSFPKDTTQGRERPP